MIDANDFRGACDSEVIENAIAHRQPDGIVVIPPRVSAVEPERSFWLLDRAVLIPENTTVLLRNCTIRLSDRCRDNFFRTANCGMGIGFPERIRNVHLRGEGLCVLQGADRPRATGDSSKLLACPCPYEPEDLCRLAAWIPSSRRTPATLDFWDRHDHSYGTDTGKEGESQYGDWRGIGILFANAEDFSIEGLRVAESHGWGISLEACSFGRVSQITFDACMSKAIDGMRQNMENQDGVDIRNGCHHITITDIGGRTGDDLVALTAIADESETPLAGGSLRSTHVMHEDWTKRDRDIHDIIIRNVMGYSHLCFLIRLLPANASIRNIVIDGVVDTTPEGLETGAGLLFGEADGAYGVNKPDGLSNISVSNVLCNRVSAIDVAGYLRDSVITNVVNRKAGRPVIAVWRKDGMRRVTMGSLLANGGEIVRE